MIEPATKKINNRKEEKSRYDHDIHNAAMLAFARDFKTVDIIEILKMCLK